MKVEIAGASYEIRPYRDTDEEDVVALHRLVFGPEGRRALGEREWRYRRNPAGGHLTSVCVSEDGRIVCAYAGIPLRGQLLGSPATFALVVDTMTHPEFRGAVLGRRGLLVRTALDWKERYVGEGGVAFCYGAPEARNSRLGSLALGYRLWDEIGSYGRVVEDSVIKRIRRGLGDRRLVRVDEVGPEADDLWSRAARRYPTAVIRDRAYLSWRYRGGAERDYVILAARSGTDWSGWLVLAVRDDATTIADAILPSDPDAADALLYRAVLESLARGATWLEGWATVDSDLGRLYERSGFARRPQEGTYFACHVAAAADEAAVRRTLFIQPGDTDAV